MFKFVIEDNGIRFNIINNRKEIRFEDENGGTITWERTDYNAYIVECFVQEISGSRVKL